MPPPIVPAPTTAARLISVRRRVLRDVGHLGDLALGEEQMAQRLRFGRDDAVGEQLALAHRALRRSGSVSAGFDRVDGGERRAHALARSSSATRASPRTPRGRAFTPSAAIGDVARPCGSRAPPPSPSRTRSRRAADRRRRCRSMMPAASAFGAGTGLPSVHISSASFAPHRRGSRCVPPAPGMMPSSTSGWPTFASLRRDAEVAGLRDLEAAAERVAVNRGDERLGRRPPGASAARACPPIAPASRSRVFSSVEDLDVGAGDERRAGADEHDRLGRRIGDARARPPRRSRPRPPGASAFTGGLSIVRTATPSLTS